MLCKSVIAGTLLFSSVTFGATVEVETILLTCGDDGIKVQRTLPEAECDSNECEVHFRVQNILSPSQTLPLFAFDQIEDCRERATTLIFEGEIGPGMFFGRRKSFSETFQVVDLKSLLNAFPNLCVVKFGARYKDCMASSHAPGWNYDESLCGFVRVQEQMNG